MKKDKAWLIQKVSDIFWRVEIDGNFNIQNANIMFDDISNLIDELDELDEPEKPVIPQFVADWIESQDDPIYEMCVNYEMWGVNGDDGTTRFTGEIAEWFDDTLNVENYYRACIDGYEVEKEKRYYVKIQSQFLCVGKNHKEFIALQYHEDINAAEKCEFTEQEIKAIDERYWAFAEEVKE